MKQTPSQTIGPFFAHGLTPEQYGYDFTSIASGVLAAVSVEGEQMLIRGQVFDGKGESVGDAMLEYWQADSHGVYNRIEQQPKKDTFHGFGRVGTGTHNDNRFAIRSIKPGSVDGQAPHIHVIVFMRGMLNHQFTRIYFSDEEEANTQDAVLNLVPQERRHTLIAKRTDRADLIEYQFDIYLQGEKETVFFDI